MYWGIDLGGTKIEGVAFNNPEKPEIVSRIRVPTEADKGYEHIIAQAKKLIDQMIDQVGQAPAKIGIGTPGCIDPFSGLMKNANTTSLNGKPFHRDLEAALNIPIKMANDANCLVLAEAKLGAVKLKMPEAKVVFGVIMGSGVGGGIVVNGQIIEGAHGIAGEWGHNFLDESGGPCYCGRNGCVETVLSGKSLERYYREQSGVDKKLKQIFEESQNDPEGLGALTIDRLLHFFGKGIAGIINVLDPDAIVLGGGVGNIDLLYQQAEKRILPFLFNPELRTKILKPEMGDSAGVFGAAFL